MWVTEFQTWKQTVGSGASRLCGTQQLRCPHKICLSNICSVYSYKHSLQYHPIIKITVVSSSHQVRQTPGNKMQQRPLLGNSLQWGFFRNSLTSSTGTFFSYGRPREWHCWKFQKVLGNTGQGLAGVYWQGSAHGGGGLQCHVLAAPQCNPGGHCLVSVHKLLGCVNICCIRCLAFVTMCLTLG